MPSRVLDFPIFDVDNHMYETTDAFTKYAAILAGVSDPVAKHVP